MGKQQAKGTPKADADVPKADPPKAGKSKATLSQGDAKPAKLLEGKVKGRGDAAPAKDAKAGGKAGAEEAKPVTGKKSEIDDIFGAAKKKAQEGAAEKRAAEEATEQADAGPSVPAAKRARVEGNKDDIFGETVGKGRKRTEEGFAIYSEDELGLGRKGGETDLCPFDCECCF